VCERGEAAHFIASSSWVGGRYRRHVSSAARDNGARVACRGKQRMFNRERGRRRRKADLVASSSLPREQYYCCERAYFMARASRPWVAAYSRRVHCWPREAACFVASTSRPRKQHVISNASHAPVMAYVCRKWTARRCRGKQHHYCERVMREHRVPRKQHNSCSRERRCRGKQHSFVAISPQAAGSCLIHCEGVAGCRK